MRSQERLPDYQAMTVWCTSELPVNNDESAFNNGEAGPKGQRVLLRIGEMGPDAHSASVMHRTETLDYAVVLAGTCDMELDNGEMIRTEEHTSELQSLMRISYAVFCLKKKKKK